MPGRNIVKNYIENGYYHIYNRGVEKRKIFQDEQDYRVLLKYLKEYLSPPQERAKITKTFTLKGSTFKGMPRQPNNYFQEIELLAYCLMPNHFHLLIKQKNLFSIKKYMQSLSTRYSMYFNKKYNRTGTLFQGVYKAVLIQNDDYLLHLTRYIHLNPLEYTSNLANAYSSYAEYLRIRKTQWIKPDFVLSFFETKVDPIFSKYNSYKKFVEKYPEKSEEVLEKLTLES